LADDAGVDPEVVDGGDVDLVVDEAAVVVARSATASDAIDDFDDDEDETEEEVEVEEDDEGGERVVSTGDDVVDDEDTNDDTNELNPLTPLYDDGHVVTSIPDIIGTSSECHDVEDMEGDAIPST
jgi:ribonuclease E